MSKKIHIILSNLSVTVVSRARFIVSTIEDLNKSNSGFYELSIIAIDPISGDSIPLGDQFLSYYESNADIRNGHGIEIIALDMLSYVFGCVNSSGENRVSVWCSHDEHLNIIPDFSVSLILSLIEICNDKVYGVSREDAIKWSSQINYIPDFISSGSGLFDASVSFEPLIEKGSKKRFMIDAQDFRSIHHLKEAFSSLEKHDCEVWCMTNIKLYDWMKPDMLFEKIFRGEEGIHYSSVDAVILDVFNPASQAKALDLYSRGILPISIDINQYSIELSRMLSNKFIYIEGDLEHRIGKAIAVLDSSAIHQIEMQNTFIDHTRLTNYKSKIDEILSNPDTMNRATYNNSALLKAIVINLRQNNINLKIVMELPQQSASLIQFTGWSLSIANKKPCDLLFIKDDIILEPIVERFDRPDVNEIYNIRSGVEVGFLLRCLYITGQNDDAKSPFPLLAIDNELSVGSYIPSLENDSSFLIEKNQLKIIGKRDRTVSIRPDEIKGYIENTKTISGYVFRIDPLVSSFDKVRFRTTDGITEPIKFVMAVERRERSNMYESEFVLSGDKELMIPDWLSSYIIDYSLIYIWANNNSIRCIIID